MERSLNESGGYRYNSKKLRFDLLPADALTELVKVYTQGAQKYEPRNWELGLSWTETSGSLLRHLFKFMMGEKIDEDSGLHHMAHAAWNAITLLAMSLRDAGSDDRQPFEAEYLKNNEFHYKYEKGDVKDEK